MERLGWSNGVVRGPLCPPSDEVRRIIDESLNAFHR
jgi:hypothetical protein